MQLPVFFTSLFFDVSVSNNMISKAMLFGIIFSFYIKLNEKLLYRLDSIVVRVFALLSVDLGFIS